MTRTAEVVVAQIGGNCPVQAEGTVGGEPFYFRARGSRWSMEIGGAAGVGVAAWEYSESYGIWPDAGWMPEGDARAFIAKAALLWAAQSSESPPLGSAERSEPKAIQSKPNPNPNPPLRGER